MKKCPRCKYALEGLPSEYTCPECGLRYCGETTFVQLRGTRDSWQQAVFVLVSTAWVVFSPGLRAQPYGELILRLWLIAIPLSFGMYFYRSRKESLGELIIDRERIELTRPNKDRQVFEISAVRRAEYSWRTGRLVVLGPDDQTLFELKHWELGGPSVGRECVHKINRLAVGGHKADIALSSNTG